jgi:MerR family transcriptional regulator, light-induced transcriptional regulator
VFGAGHAECPADGVDVERASRPANSLSPAEDPIVKDVLDQGATTDQADQRASPATASSHGGGSPLYRVGALARMTRLPIATLHNWERRYNITRAVTTASGHRLYKAVDVQRVLLLKQLVDVGHSIGSIAHLDDDGLREVAATHVQTMTAGPRLDLPAATRPWRVVVAGSALLHRLLSAGISQGLQHGLDIVATFTSLAEVSAAAEGMAVDTLLIQVAGLHRESLAAVQSAGRAVDAVNVAVCYGVGSNLRRKEFEAAGINLLQMPQGDAELAIALQDIHDHAVTQTQGCGTDDASAAAGALLLKTGLPAWLAEAPLTPPPPRYDDAVLADFAGLSSTISCECPQHVADLLTRLSAFETYSAECEQLTPQDVELHGWLKQIAGTARALFETALQRIAVHEGLMLPD